MERQNETAAAADIADLEHVLAERAPALELGSMSNEKEAQSNLECVLLALTFEHLRAGPSANEVRAFADNLAARYVSPLITGLIKESLYEEPADINYLLHGLVMGVETYARHFEQPPSVPAATLIEFASTPGVNSYTRNQVLCAVVSWYDAEPAQTTFAAMAEDILALVQQADIDAIPWATYHHAADLLAAIKK